MLKAWKVAQSWGEGAWKGRTPRPAAAGKVVRSLDAPAERGRSLGDAQPWRAFLRTPGPALCVLWAKESLIEPGHPQGEKRGPGSPQEEWKAARSWGAPAERGRSLGDARPWRPFLQIPGPDLCGLWVKESPNESANPQGEKLSGTGSPWGTPPKLWS